MEDVEEFLAHAIRLEEDAANRFADLANAMKTYGNHEAAHFFGKLAHFSRQHLADARARAGFHVIPNLKEDEYHWGSDESPEATSMEASHYLMEMDYAIQLAIESERSGFAFYDNVAKTTRDPEIRRMAEEFAIEEAGHVAELERWIAERAA